MATMEELKERINMLEKRISKLQKPAKRSDENFDNAKKEDSVKEIRILLDTSCLFAMACQTDAHYISVKSIVDALRPYKVSFYVPFLVFMESMSRLIKSEKQTVKAARSKLLKIITSILNAKMDSGFDYKEVFKSYDIYSRKAIKGLTAIDFYIVVTGIGLSSIILTCDLEMYEKTKKSYKDIFFVTDQSSKKDSDSPKLMKKIIKMQQKKT